MREFKINPKYAPPPIPDFLFWSNFPQTYTEQEAIMAAVARLGVPKADVIVKPFKEGMISVYVRSCHVDKLQAFNDHLNSLLRFFDDVYGHPEC